MMSPTSKQRQLLESMKPMELRNKNLSSVKKVANTCLMQWLAKSKSSKCVNLE